MNWTDNLPKSVRDDIRAAGRGHLLGEYRSPLDAADEARKRAKEEPTMGNTDAEEIARGKSEPANSGMTSGVRDGNTQGVDGRFQNDGVDDIKPEVDPVEEEPQGDELGSVDEAADGVEDDDGL